MDLFCFTEFSAVFALRDWATLFLNFEQGTIGVFTGRGPMSLYARFTAASDPCPMRCGERR